MAQKKNQPRPRIRRTQSGYNYLETLTKGIIAWGGTLGIMMILGIIVHFLLK